MKCCKPEVTETLKRQGYDAVMELSCWHWVATKHIKSIGGRLQIDLRDEGVIGWRAQWSLDRPWPVRSSSKVFRELDCVFEFESKTLFSLIGFAHECEQRKMKCI